MQHITLVSLSLLILLLLLANPFELWMPSSLAYLSVVCLAVVAVLFAGLVYMEHPKDEREQVMRDSAGRLGYLVGVIILTAAVVISVISGDHANPWVIGALGAMVLSRLFVRFFSK